MTFLVPPLKLPARLPAALEHPPNVCCHLVASLPSLDGDLLLGKPLRASGARISLKELSSQSFVVL